MKKHKDYFRRFGITTLIYTDSDLADVSGIFDDIKPYLMPKAKPVQLNFNLMNELFM